MQKDEFIEIYTKSMIELEKLIKKNKARPSEKAWNKYAIENGFLLSGTLGYISGIGFNKLCRQIIKNK